MGLLTNLAVLTALLFINTCESVNIFIPTKSFSSTYKYGKLVSLSAKQLRRYSYILGVDTSLDESGKPINAMVGNIIGISFADQLNDILKKSTSTSYFVATKQDITDIYPSLHKNCQPTEENGYAICHNTNTNGASIISVVGMDEAATYYGVHTLLENYYGCSFGLGGPTIPTARTSRNHVQQHFPVGTHLQQSPVFTLRGLQPFHDFDSGPDWWSEDEQKRVLESISTMKGNFLGYHTYPVVEGSFGTGTNEPATWIGLTNNVLPDGTVNYAYPTSWANTLRAEWGMTAINTSDYIGGADAIFEYDCYGHPVQAGDPNMCPWPVDVNHSVLLFNRVGALWQSVFSYAHQIGVKTCIGTETPISVPNLPPDLQVPLNVYYSSSRDDHFVTTTQCDECEDLYEFIGVTGYVYSGPQPGLIGLTTYYNAGITDNILLPDGQTPPNGYGFVRVEGYALPSSFTPTNNSITSLHQYLQSSPKVDHWAVAGSMINNASASGYTDTGVIAYVWTTGTGSNITSQDWYEGVFTRLDRLLGDNLDYYWIWTPEDWEWSKVSINNSLVQDVVVDVQNLMNAYNNVGANFNLATCGWVIGPLGYRSYFDTVLPTLPHPTWSMSSIDMEVGNTPVDGNYSLITRHEKWDIPWLEDDPGLTAPELWLNRTLEHCAAAQSYNITGLQLIHWRTRQVSPQAAAGHAYAWNSSITSADFWLQWANAQFGPSIASQAAAIFVSIDSFNLPRPVNWVTGPGTMTASSSQCGWASTYAFVDAFTQLRPSLLADVAVGLADASNVENFDYWAYAFMYMRGIARMECDWDNYNNVISTIQKINDPNQRQQAARTQGFAARASLVQNVTRMIWDHLTRVTSFGDLGTITNMLSQSLYQAIGAGPTSVLENLAGESLPPNCMPATTYDPTLPPVLRVLVARSMLASGEPFRMECFILTTPSQAPTSVTLYTAPMGSTSYTATPMVQVPGDGHTRQVYKTVLPNGFTSDFQWYIQANLPSNATMYNTDLMGIPAGTHITSEGVTLYYPPNAPQGPQTVIIV